VTPLQLPVLLLVLKAEITCDGSRPKARHWEGIFLCGETEFR
jgi:hypothetical protein